MRRYFSIVIFLTSTSFLAAQTTYNYVDLSNFVPGVIGSAAGINNQGHIFLNTGHANLYTNGSITQIPENFGLTNLSVSAFNNRDEVIGWGTAADGSRHTYYYNFSTATSALREYTTEQSSERLLGINDLGQVGVGGFSGTPSITRVFDGGNMIIPPGGYALGMNDNGDLLQGGQDGFHLWNTRTGYTSASVGLGITGIVFGNNGWVGGSSPTSLYRARLGGFSPPPSEQVGSWRYPLYASAINGSGVMVGSLWDYLIEPWHAFVSFGDRAWDLNTLTTAPEGWELFVVQDINDNGEIIGLARNQNTSVLRPFLLEPTGAVPVPEPAAYSMMGLGILIFAAYRRTRKIAERTCHASRD